MAICGKCMGTGYLSEYSHIAGGVCFQCRGTGRVDSRNKPLMEIRAREILKAIKGLNKTQTAALYSVVLEARRDAYWIVKNGVGNADYDVLVSVGLLTATDETHEIICNGRRYTETGRHYAPAAGVKIDWSNVK